MDQVGKEKKTKYAINPSGIIFMWDSTGPLPLGCTEINLKPGKEVKIVKVLCPVCDGLGYIDSEEYKTKRPLKIMCHGCDGNGYTEELEFEEDPK